MIGRMHQNLHKRQTILLKLMQDKVNYFSFRIDSPANDRPRRYSSVSCPSKGVTKPRLVYVSTAICLVSLHPMLSPHCHCVFSSTLSCFLQHMTSHEMNAIWDESTITRPRRLHDVIQDLAYNSEPCLNRSGRPSLRIERLNDGWIDTILWR